MRTEFTVRSFAAALLATAALGLPSASAAQDEDGEEKEEKWDIAAPRGAAIRQVPIRSDEGTWMDLDVSPDAKTVAFTLLGDIYTMPISGGTPTRIAQGPAWEVHPRFSPDGARIAFTSDRSGGDNIWVMNADGSDKRQLTREDFRLMNQPAWSPDGQFIAAKKHFTTERSAGTGEIWMFHVSGGGGVAIVKRPNEKHQKELGEPVFAPDGSAIYYTRNTTPGGTFIYAQDSTTGIFAIERFDLETGEVTTAVDGFGGAVRAAPSPDGKTIAFVRRDKDQSQLWVKDISSGKEQMIYADLDLDMQETWAVHGVYPNMDWTPDGSSIVFWAGGKIRRVGKDGSGAQVIPFAIDDTRSIADAPHPVIEVAPDRFTTTMPRFATLSPDGSRVVFESMGKLYTRSSRGSEDSRRLIQGGGDVLELWPAFSRDGRKLAYVRWSDEGLGEIVVADANGRNPRVVTSAPGHYGVPQFSPDGTRIAFEKREGGYLTSPEYSQDPGVYVISTGGGEAELVARDASAPQFADDSGRIFMVASDGDKAALVSTDLDGEARRVHARGELANDFRISPDGKVIAFRQNYEVFAMPVIPGGQPVDVGEKEGPLPVTRVSSGGADYIGWANGGKTLHWSIGPTLMTASVTDLFNNAPKAQGEKEAAAFSPPEAGISLALAIDASKPTGVLALTGARVLTMAAGLSQDDPGAIDNATLVIRGDRIAAVGAAGDIAIPDGAKVINMDGKVIMPGLVDAHAHGPYGTGDLVPQQNWTLIQDLALGVTTVHNPSSDASEVFAAAERQRSGQILGPRIFSTGEIIYGARAPAYYARIDSYEDALAHVRRIKAQGGVSVKNYNQPRREQRQQVVRAAAAENMLVVAEGGSLFGMDMNMVADGNSTIEHNVPGEHFYEDVLQLFSQSDSNYTPTLVVTYGGLAGDPYWRQATDVFANPLLIHTSPKHLIAQTARRTKAPEWAFVDDDNAREAKKLADRGVKVSIGAHGQQAGIGAHWELWSFVRGGMSAAQALRAGTIAPAQSLGMAADIGSIEAGKLADLVVLSADPSADIRNSDKIERVMLGGRLYDSMTMNEVETGISQRRKYWWE